VLLCAFSNDLAHGALDTTATCSHNNLAPVRGAQCVQYGKHHGQYVELVTRSCAAQLHPALFGWRTSHRHNRNSTILAGHSVCSWREFTVTALAAVGCAASARKCDLYNALQGDHRGAVHCSLCGLHTLPRTYLKNCIDQAGPPEASLTSSDGARINKGKIRYPRICFVLPFADRSIVQLLCAQISTRRNHIVLLRFNGIRRGQHLPGRSIRVRSFQL
jgi:hypothetical protein